MKNAIAFITLFSLISVGAQAQKTATWKGGTPGRNSDWNCPTNWQEGRVPDEFSAVFIPDVSTRTFAYPLINKGLVTISSLQCASNAYVTTMGDAEVIVLDQAAKDAGCRIVPLLKEKTPSKEDSTLAQKNYPR